FDMWGQLDCRIPQSEWPSHRARQSMDTRTCGVATQLSRNSGLFRGEAKVGRLDELGGSGFPSECRVQAERGDVPSLHPLGDGPWVFKRTDLDLPTIRQRIKAPS